MMNTTRALNTLRNRNDIYEYFLSKYPDDIAEELAEEYITGLERATSKKTGSYQDDELGGTPNVIH